MKVRNAWGSSLPVKQQALKIANFVVDKLKDCFKIGNNLQMKYLYSIKMQICTDGKVESKRIIRNVQAQHPRVIDVVEVGYRFPLQGPLSL